MSKPKAPRRSSLKLVATAPGDVPYRRTNLGDCTCGYGFADLIIGTTFPPPKIIAVCPECGQQWELELTLATRKSMAAVLGIKKEEESS